MIQPYNQDRKMKMQYPNAVINAAVKKPELRYLEGFLKGSGDKPLYILAVLRSNVPESIIEDIEKAYERNNDVIGVTGLIDTVVIVTNNKEEVPRICKGLGSATGKYVGILEYKTETDMIRLYAEIFQAANLAEKETKDDRLYQPEKDSLEGKLGMMNQPVKS